MDIDAEGKETLKVLSTILTKFYKWKFTN